MSRFALLLLIALNGSDPGKPSITANRKFVQPGEESTLTWKSDGRAAFLSGIGKVPPSGSLSVRPGRSTTYVLIVELEAQIQSASVEVQVSGSKGIEGFPDVQSFGHRVVGTVTGLTYTELLDLAFKTLQDRKKFEVRGDFLPHRPYLILYTDRRPNSELVQPSDRGVGQRRIAYSVQLNEPVGNQSKALQFEVKTLIDFQRLGESRWVPETDDQLAQSASDALRRELEAGASRGGAK